MLFLFLAQNAIFFSVCLIVAYFTLKDKKEKRLLATVEYNVTPAKESGEITGEIYLVFGGCNFLGRKLAKKLWEKNRGVNIYLFDKYLPETSKQLSFVNYISGDITNLRHVQRAIIETNSTTIFHMGTISGGYSLKLLKHFNTNGAKNIVNVITKDKKSRATRLIYTSSASILIGKNDKDLENIRETRPFPKDAINNNYASMREVEEIILSISNSINLNTENKIICCSLQPTQIFGIGDQVFVDYFTKSSNHFYIGESNGIFDCIDVNNVILAHLLVEENLNVDSKLVSQTYLISHSDMMKYREFVGVNSTGPNGEENLSHWGKAHPYKRSLFICSLLAKIRELISLCVDRPPFDPSITPERIQLAQYSYSFSSQKAIDHLGFHPNGSLSDTIKKYTRKVNSNKIKMH